MLEVNYRTHPRLPLLESGPGTRDSRQGRRTDRECAHRSLYITSLPRRAIDRGEARSRFEGREPHRPPGATRPHHFGLSSSPDGQTGITAIAKLREAYGAISAFVMSVDTVLRCLDMPPLCVLRSASSRVTLRAPAASLPMTRAVSRPACYALVVVSRQIQRGPECRRSSDRSARALVSLTRGCREIRSDRSTATVPSEACWRAYCPPDGTAPLMHSLDHGHGSQGRPGSARPAP
jgi:hypothetical protein